MNDVLHATYEVARKEVLQYMRTKRLLIIVPIFFAVMVLVTIVLPVQLLKGSDITSGFANGVAIQNISMLLFFSGFFVLSGYFYLQLLPIVMTTDAVSSEWDSRTIFLLLSKPVPRAALVLGKFVASALVAAVVVAFLLVLDYVMAIAFLPGAHGTAAAWGAFLSGLGILLLGCVAFCAVGLFFSTLSRSITNGILLSLAAWIFVFPLIGQLDTIQEIANRGLNAIVDTDPQHVYWSVYLSPTSSMRVASTAIAPASSAGIGGFMARLFGFSAPGEPWIAALALVAHTLVFLGLSLWVVQRRNFE